MNFIQQAAALLWKNIYIQMLRRHYLSTILEIIFMTLYLAYFQQEVPPTRWLHRGKISVPNAKPTQWTVVNFVDNIVYGPVDPHKQFLVDEGLVPYTYEGNVTQMTSTTGSHSHRFPASKIHVYGTHEAVERSCNPANSSLCFFVTGHGPSLNLTSYTLVSGEAPPRKLELDLKTPMNTNKGSRFPGTEARALAFNIPNAHLNWVHRGKTESLLPVYTRAFPPLKLPKDVQCYRQGFAIALAVGFSLPFCLRISNIVAENSSGTKGWLESMGIHVFWISYGVSSFLIFFTGGIMASIWLHSWPHHISLQNMFNHTGSLASRYYHILPNVSWSLLITTFFMFSCLTTMHALAVASWTKWPSVAAACGAAYWLFVINGIPYHFFRPRTESLHVYFSTSSLFKLSFCVFPCLAADMMLRIIAIALDFQGSADWSIVNRPALQLDNITILQIWGVMGGTMVFLSLWVWYFSRVLYWVTDVPLPFHFPLMIEYWFPKCMPRPQPSSEEGFRRASDTMTTIIEIRELCKIYGKNPALEDLNLDVYYKEITVILGHSGSGKSTLFNIVSGVVPPTTGTATVCGLDVVQDSVAVRKCVSVCPQGDILYNDLTVRQHMYFFGLIRGMSSDTLGHEIKDMLELMGLTDVQNKLPEMLSGGMKRRLSIAMATLYPCQVLILDEPTSFLDPAARSELWTMLLTLRRRRSILLSTHSMEEADTLADHMAILVKGKMACWGTPSFLGAIFSGGYEVHIEIEDSKAQVQEIMEVVEGTCPDATVNKETTTELRIALGTSDSEGFEEMFKSLEQRALKFGIKKMLISMISIEQVFVNVNLRETSVDTIGDIRVTEEIKGTLMNRCQQPRTFQCVRALIIKRATNHWRGCIPLLLGALLPVAVLMAVMHNQSQLLDAILLDTEELSLKSDEPGAITLTSTMGDYYSGERVFLHHDANSTNMANEYCLPVLSRNSAHVDILDDPSLQLLELSNGNLRENAYKYALGISIMKDKIEAWWNPYFPYSELISAYIAFTALLRATTNDTTAEISITQHLRVEVSNDTALPTIQYRAQSAEEDSIVFGKVIAIVEGILPHVQVASALIASSAVVFIIHERTSASKAMQLMTGVSSFVFWSSSLVFDAMVAMTTWAAIGIIYALNFGLLPLSAAALVILTLVFVAASMSIVYALSHIVDQQYTAYAGTFVFFYISGHVVAAMPEGLVRSFMLVFPGAALREGFRKILVLDVQNRECLTRSSGPVWWCPADSKLVDTYQALAYCCEHENTTSDSLHLTSPFSFATDLSIIMEIIFMAIEAICLFTWICILDSAWNYVPSAPPNVTLPESNVEAERQLVHGLVEKNNFSGYSLVVHGLYKSYMPSVPNSSSGLLAVRGLSFTVKPGECFGLLGQNGAGKSTTFRILTGTLKPTSGEAYAGTLVMSQNVRQWQSRIGYCVQAEGLLDMMTATEILYLFARLRGVPETNVASSVQAVISLVDLEMCSDVISRSLSGGNKRKLCTAIALVGVPHLMLLDEPTSGLDLFTQRRILAAVKALRESSGISILLTSQDMDECEAICDRIAIMQDGHLRCLGTLIELKATYGRTYMLMIPAPTFGDDTRIDGAVFAIFQKDVLLKEFRKGRLIYHLSGRMALSRLFMRVNYLQKHYNINNMHVSSKSLEDIFIEVTRKQ
ncbi:phospholipid-transporting ATPase ABCA3-like [Ornithodoros turicata]|uniref:phospholipid-transporting ATPase ABCA3-like n=1 Tax=Ornithodoros turicata TaxID=34597 RepID=UPI00313918D5